MRRLKRKDIGPPSPPGVSDAGSFRFIHTETLHTSAAGHWHGWREAILAHRKANNLSIPDNMMEIAENQLCDTLPPQWCTHAPENQWVNPRFGLRDLRDGMKAFALLMLGGFDFVSQEEADRRAYICAGCTRQANPEGCGSCNKVAKLIIGDVAKRKTPYDAKLKSCAICKCVNAVAVHFPMKAIETTDTPEKQAAYPTWCWRSKTSEAYRP